MATFHFDAYLCKGFKYTVHSSHFDRVRLFSQISLQDRYINTLINIATLLTGQYEVMYSKGKSLKTDEIFHMILL